MLSSDINTDIPTLVQNSHLRHVAVIMDGNRRWAKQKRWPTLLGHQRGVKTLKDIVRYSQDIGLEALTVYAFSTENWNRASDEVSYLMTLFLEVLKAELNQLHKNNVRIRFIGDIQSFSTPLQQLMEKAQAKTADNTGLKFQIAANYGSRQELLTVMRQLGQKVKAGELEPTDIDEALIQNYLYTNALPDPDMLIRTGGEHRLSNYLLWQCAYAELYITETLWPDFTPDAFNQAIQEFARRERRYGQ